MNKIKNSLQSKWVILSVIVIGIGLRFLALTRGTNYDFDSYTMVLEIFERGNTVYAYTTRYNYGPIWFLILHLLNLLASKDVNTLRYVLVAFLSLVDLGIFAVLWRKLGKLAACLFFLSPISIIITGYHDQFDNLAILLGMLSVILIGDNFDKPVDRRGYLGLLTLGLSLMTKHALFAFPLWLAVKQKGIFQKIAVLSIPVTIFFLGFLPYWQTGKVGIVHNVFLYNSWKNEYFYKLFVPDVMRSFLTSWNVWIILLVFFAFYFRKRDVFSSLLLYTCILVATSPSITNQYLAIVVPFISANINPFTILYTLMGSWHLLVDDDGLHISALQAISHFSRDNFYSILVSLLFLGFVLIIWPHQLNVFLKRCWLEIKIQMGMEEPA